MNTATRMPRCWAAAVVVALVLLPGPGLGVTKQSPCSRHRAGWYIGFGIGGGGAVESFEGTPLGTMKSGLSLMFKVGGIIGGSFMIGYDWAGYGKRVDVAGEEYLLNIQHHDVMTTFYPFRDQGLFFKGGIGFAGRSNPDPLDGKENDRYTIIWGNRFHDCDAGSVYGILKMPGGESVIANNRFEGNDSTGDGLTGVIAGFSYTGMTDYDQYIFNNVFDRNTANYGDIVIDGLNLPNLHIYNNTFYGVKGSDTGIRLAFWSNDTTVGHVHNNIFSNLGTGVNMPAGSAIADDDNNFFYENNTDFAGWAPQGTVYTEDPGLADPSVGDFSLHGASATRDRGTSFVNIFTVDFRHARRDSSFDVGAYEYQAVDDTPPAAPTNLEVSTPP